MATTTPNYGWPVPTSGDLVKDGATAIEALGDAIDATVFASAAGLVKISGASFSAASSVILPANTFSSTYKNYRLIINQTSGSATSSLKLRLRTGSTDDSGGNYAYAGIYTRSDSATIASWRDPIGQTSIPLGDYNSSRPTMFNVEIYNPQIATQTTTKMTCSNPDTSNTLFHFDGMGYHSQGTSYDAATIFPLSGTITGAYVIYGYKV